MTKVYIVNDHAHDFSMATRYGEFKAITTGRINVLNTHELYLQIKEAIEDSTSDDFLLICGHHLLNILAYQAWMLKNGAVRLLVYDAIKNRYLIRDLSMWDLARKHDKSLGEITNGWTNTSSQYDGRGIDGVHEEDSLDALDSTEGC